MTLRFGVDLPPDGKAVRMAYVGRAACGHVRALVVDTRPGSVDEFLALGIAGLTLERIPLDQARDEFGECERCLEPPQLELPL